MKRNFRKIPVSILEKLETIKTSNIQVAAILALKESDFRKQHLLGLDLKLTNGQLDYVSEYVPASSKGRYSKKNIQGYKIKYPDRPRIPETFYLGERPVYGDYNNGSFPLFVTRDVIAFDKIPPKEISIKTEFLEKKMINNELHYVIKVYTSEILTKNNTNFKDELFFNLNLLQENVASVDIFATDASIEDYLETLSVTWDFFPPGEIDSDLKKIVKNIRNLTPYRAEQIKERYIFLREQKPIRMIVGTSGMRRYFGAQFSENLVAFENTEYGNALYILFEKWEELSKLTRREIQNRSSDQFVRIVHGADWKAKTKAVISSRR
jgi:hypothetical protein